MNLSQKFMGKRVRHAFIGSGASAASLNVAAPGTGLANIPIAFWVSASAVGSFVCYNGTAGSQLFRIHSQLGGVWSGDFWDDTIAANKILVLETQTGPGDADFHVWYIVARVGAGQDPVKP